jgi:hypothetical protein
METIELLTCSQCRGKGYYGIDGFDGRERVDCLDCQEKGTIEFVVTDWDAYEIEVLGMTAEAFNAIADVEAFLGVAPVAPISVDHPGMTAQFFDKAIKRAHDAGLAITFTGPETALVSSASNSTVRYLTTRTRCSCTGGTTHNRCLHRAYLIAHLDVFRAPVAEPIAA